VSLSDRMDSSRARLAGVTYDRAAGDLVRFRATETDDAVAALVRAVVAEGWDGAEEFRRALTRDALDALALFVARRVVLARRSSSMSAVYEALDAVALMAAPEEVAWDSWVKTGLFVARTLGGDADQLNRQFEDVASEDLVGRWHVALEAMNRVEELSQCHMAEVATSYGVGLVELLTFPDSPGGFYRAPGLAKGPVPYAPVTNLADLAVRLADSLDASGAVSTGPLVQDQLAATTFTLTSAGSYIECTGCLSFEAAGHDARGAYLVYVAELPGGTDVAALADAAASTGAQSSLYEGQRLIVLSPQPSFDEADDEPVDLAGAESLAVAALNGAAAS
jgi:hypothetical protein